MTVTDQVDHSVINLAIEAMSTENFELFSQAMLRAIYGMEFEPSGGFHDGGQDGFFRSQTGKPQNYAQISKEKDVKAKIKKTLKRLKKSDRECRRLFHVCSAPFPEKDIVEPEIEREFDSVITIIDRRAILQHLIASPELKSTFRSFASTAIDEILAISRSGVTSYQNPSRLSIVTYLEIHASDQPHENDFLIIAADAAIYQALEGTSADEDIFKTKDEILDSVLIRCPALKKNNNIRIEDRLARLSSKQSSPRIRKHPNDEYCLPYEIRKELNEKNVVINTMESDFLCSMKSRAKNALEESEGDLVDEVVRVSFIAVNETFKANAINMAKFIVEGDSNHEDVNTYEYVEAAIDAKFSGERRIALRATCEQVIREVFYSGNEVEQNYLLALFKLNSIEFILSGDDRVIRFFRQMLKNMRLIIGTDILVRALSEYCLNTTSQATMNMLRLLDQFGVKLFVTDSILQELYYHIRTTIFEFENDFQPWEKHAKMWQVKYAGRILIRSYFYAKLEPERHNYSPSNWNEYINKIASMSWFDESKSGKEDFGKLILRRFKLDKLSKFDIEEIVNQARVDQLADELSDFRKSDRLAENDAMIASYVNMYRDKFDENNHNHIHGFSTWWLTEENKIVKLARGISMRAKFVMHPHTLMSYIIAHSAATDLLEKNQPNFPVNFGLKITERVHQQGFKSFIDEMKKVDALDKDVQHIRIQSAANQLLGKSYI